MQRGFWIREEFEAIMKGRFAVIRNLRVTSCTFTWLMGPSFGIKKEVEGLWAHDAVSWCPNFIFRPINSGQRSISAFSRPRIGYSVLLCSLFWYISAFHAHDVSQNFRKRSKKVSKKVSALKKFLAEKYFPPLRSIEISQNKVMNNKGCTVFGRVHSIKIGCSAVSHSHRSEI